MGSDSVGPGSDTHVNAVYCRLTNAPVDRTEEVVAGEVLIDRDTSGSIVGIEILGAAYPPGGGWIVTRAVMADSPPSPYWLIGRLIGQASLALPAVAGDAPRTVDYMLIDRRVTAPEVEELLRFAQRAGLEPGQVRYLAVLRRFVGVLDDDAQRDLHRGWVDARARPFSLTGEIDSQVEVYPEEA